MAWLESHQHEIVTGKLVVFSQDECHLLWGETFVAMFGAKQANGLKCRRSTNAKSKLNYGALNPHSARNGR